MANVTAKQRILSIQACRGIAAMLVVFNHLHNVEWKYFHTHWMDGFQYGVAGVDLFFVVSGVVITLVTAGKFGSARNAAKFLYHRIARIYPVLWFYSAIVLAAWLYNPNLINAAGGHHVDVLRSFLLIPSQYQALIMQSWSLSYEMYFYLVFFLLLLLPQRCAPWLLGAWACAIAALYATHPALAPLLASPLVYEFLAGCVLLVLYRRNALHPRAGVVLLAASLLWFAGLVYWTNHAHGGNQFWIEGSPLLRPLLYGPPAALFVLGALELEKSGLVRIARPFVALGDWSYSIYLCHLMLVELVGRLVARLLPGSSAAILMVDAVALPLVVGAGYLSYRWIERPVTDFLYGSDRKPASLRV